MGLLTPTVSICYLDPVLRLQPQTSPTQNELEDSLHVLPGGLSCLKDCMVRGRLKGPAPGSGVRSSQSACD